VVPLVPMRNVVLFPHVMTPVTVGRRSLAALAHAAAHGTPIVVVLQKDASEDDPGRCRCARWARWLRWRTAAARRRTGAARGVPGPAARAPRRADRQGTPSWPWPASSAWTSPPATTEAQALAPPQLRQRGAAAAGLTRTPGVPAGSSRQLLQATRAPSQLADLVSPASWTPSRPEKQRLLETVPVHERLARVLQRVEHRLEVLRLSQEIGARTREQLDHRQRRVPAGRADARHPQGARRRGRGAQDLARLGEAIARAQMPAEAEAQARKELQRLQRMGEASGEHSMSRLAGVDDRLLASPSRCRSTSTPRSARCRTTTTGCRALKQRMVDPCP
jgi:ATP-dependent Lon protease